MRVETLGRVTRLTFDRPERRNALDPVTVAAIREQLAISAADSGVSLVQLAAEGPVWCAGADLLALAADPGGRAAAMHEFADLLADTAESPVPVLAVVDGAVLGGGVGLLGAVDLVAMGVRGSVCLPEAGVGLWPMMVGALLGRLVSPRKAMELALTGRTLRAAECLAEGLATRVDDDAAAGRDALTASVLRQAPLAVRAGRAAWRASAGLEPPALRARLHELADALETLATGEEAREGIAAFLQKRPPVW